LAIFIQQYILINIKSKWKHMFYDLVLICLKKDWWVNSGTQNKKGEIQHKIRVFEKKIMTAGQ